MDTFFTCLLISLGILKIVFIIVGEISSDRREAREKRLLLKNEEQPHLIISEPTQKEGQAQPQKSQPLSKLARPPRNIADPQSWTIKVVDRDTKAIVQQAASRSGKPLGEWFNEDVRAFAQSQIQIKKGNKVAAIQEDLDRPV